MASPTSSAKKLIRSKSGLKIVPLSDTERSPFELQEPEWIPDKMHHCRRCGRVCCASCCETRLSLPRMCFLDPVRVCGPCAEATTKENLFYNKDLKVLITGAILTQTTSNSNEANSLVHCRLTPDHRQLIVAGSIEDGPIPLLIPMHRVSGLHVLGREQDSLSLTISALVVRYCLPGEDEEEVGLAAPPDASTSAFAFLTALEKAVFMMQESRAVIGTGE